MNIVPLWESNPPSPPLCGWPNFCFLWEKYERKSPKYQELKWTFPFGYLCQQKIETKHKLTSLERNFYISGKSFSLNRTASCSYCLGIGRYVVAFWSEFRIDKTISYINNQLRSIQWRRVICRAQCVIHRHSMVCPMKWNGYFQNILITLNKRNERGVLPHSIGYGSQTVLTKL